MKRCTKCNQEKPLDEFNKNAARKDGLQAVCRVCDRARQKARFERDVRTNPRKPYVNQTRPSIYENAIEVKLVGKNDAWVILDLEDFERFHDYKLYAVKGYAYVRPEAKLVSVHKLIVDYPIVDHINRDRLDNRKINLRAATKSQNAMNASKPKHNTSGFKGVSWCKLTKKWKAGIKANGRSKTLGYFVDILDAAKAHDAAALELFGDFAVLNFPLEAAV